MLRVVFLEADICVEFTFHLRQNSRNKQLNISLPKKDFPQLKNRNPKLMRIRGEFEFLE